MSTDPLDLPFQRSTPERANLSASQAADESALLRAEHILLAEFTHASVVAYQVYEERTDLLNHYLILCGVVATASGIAVTYSFEAHVVGPLLAVIAGLAIATIVSFAFFVRLVGISSERQEALATMNDIKEFYIQQLQEPWPRLHEAFRWRVGKRSGHRWFSGATMLTAFIIALIGSFYLGVATELLFYYTKAFGHVITVPIYIGTIRISGLVLDGPVFLVTFALFGFLYWRARRGLRNV